MVHKPLDGPPPPLERLLTVYGRNAVFETLQDASLECFCLHLAHSNRQSGIIRDIRQLAERRGIAIREHSREELSRISRNGRQDQGVAVDVLCPAFRTLEGFLGQRRASEPCRLLAVDGVTNPQNLGMIIRSAAAGDIDGVLLARRKTAALGPLVIKASAGTVFRAPIIQCPDLARGLQDCLAQEAQLCLLDGNAETSLFEHDEGPFTVYIVGNETDGVSGDSARLATTRLRVPMRNGVESLNVAVTASLIAYLPRYNNQG